MGKSFNEWLGSITEHIRAKSAGGTRGTVASSGSQTDPHTTVAPTTYPIYSPEGDVLALLCPSCGTALHSNFNNTLVCTNPSCPVI